MIYTLLLTLASSPYTVPSIAFAICFVAAINKIRSIKIKDVEIVMEISLEEE